MQADLTDTIGRLTQARDQALPPAPPVRWGPRTRPVFIALLRALSTKVGPEVLKNVEIPNDGFEPVPAELWSRILMAMAIVGQDVAPPTAEGPLLNLLAGLTRAISSVDPATLDAEV